METIEEIHAGEYVGSVFAFDTQANALLGTEGDVYGVVILLQFTQTEFGADLRVAL